MQPTGSGQLFLAVLVLGALAVGAYFVFFAEEDTKGNGGGATTVQGIGISVAQPGAGAQPTQRPANLPPGAAGADQIITVNMQFTQTLLRKEGSCPANAPAPGLDLSPRAPTRVVINKTKRTIQLENSDGTKSEVAPYDANTGQAIITYQNLPDNRASIIKVADTNLDGESTFFPFRQPQGGQSFPDCKFVLKTTARVVP